MEYGLYAAKAASLRSLDLSRQVGAAIFTKSGELIAQGSNEVPKAGGGTYWSDENADDRDYKRGVDSNYKRKLELLSELFEQSSNTRDELINKYRRTQFMNSLEYGRMIHAEMSAICDAARMGRALLGSILYTTTFPCHLCAKHIVASGIDEVVFLEPYPKSLASELHSDSIQIEGQSREKYDDYPATRFNHFYGITPRRYRDLFERDSRKTEDGFLQEWRDGQKRPIIDIRAPVYLQLESATMEAVLFPLLEANEIAINDLPLIFKSESSAVSPSSDGSLAEPTPP